MRLPSPQFSTDHDSFTNLDSLVNHDMVGDLGILTDMGLRPNASIPPPILDELPTAVPEQISQPWLILTRAQSEAFSSIDVPAFIQTLPPIIAPPSIVTPSATWVSSSI